MLMMWNVKASHTFLNKNVLWNLITGQIRLYTAHHWYVCVAKWQVHLSTLHTKQD